MLKANATAASRVNHTGAREMEDAAPVSHMLLSPLPELLVGFGRAVDSEAGRMSTGMETLWPVTEFVYTTYNLGNLLLVDLSPP